MNVLCSTRASLVLCGTSAAASEEQLYDIDGFRPGFTMQFLMAMRKTAALCLQSFDERSQQRSHPKVTA
jgi:hypothetical protein